jgi:protein SCO1/2
VNRILVLLLSLLFTTIATSATESAGLKAGVFSPPRQAPEFSLRGSDGAELKLSRYRGKVVLLAFGYTHCSEVCPVTLAVLAQARKKLGATGNEMQVVYITVDPERDNAAHMRQYLSGFDPTFIGGTGMPDQLAAVRKNYGIVANKVASAGGYSVDHSSYVYMIDREGNLRAMMPYGQSAGDYVHDVKILLKK